MDPSPLIAGLGDIEALKHMPLERRDLSSSTYELLQRSAQRHGQRIALSCLLYSSATEEPSRISCAELFARVTQTANALHRLGLESHQAMSFLLPDLPRAHYVIWGGEAAGIVNVINLLLELKHIAELVRTFSTRVLVTPAPFPGTGLRQKVAGLHAQLPKLYTIVAVGPANLLPAPQREAPKAQRGPLPEGVLDFDTLVADCPADRLESERAIHPGDVTSHFHTGGTTGTPKLAPHSHFNKVAMAGTMGLNADYGVNDVLLCDLPLFYVNDVMVTGLVPFHRGTQMLLAGPQDYRNPTLTQSFWRLVKRYRITGFSGVPTIYAALLRVPGDDRDLSSLRSILCDAAPMPVRLVRQFEARTGLKVIEGYGLTEGTCGTSCNPRGSEHQPGSIGLRLPYCRVKVAVLGGGGNYLRDATPNEVGNLRPKGLTVFKGYPQRGRNRNIWVGDGWFNTGNLGRIGEDSYIRLTGRSEDLIIRGGHNTDSQMIEKALRRHPAVALAAAVGKPDAKTGELPVAYIQLRPGASASEEGLLEHASRHVPERTAVPEDVRLVKNMPVAAMGKTFKPALRLDAIRRVLEGESRRVAEDIRAEVVADERHGQLAHLHIPAPDERCRAALEELLGGYALNYRPRTV